MGYELHAWIRSFLLGRTQKVTYRSSVSSTSCVRSGVPQGSVLGPLLFLIHVYVNDLPDELSSSSSIKMYADDAKIYHEYKPQSSLNMFSQDLTGFYDWSRKWQLSVAFRKCQVLHLGYHNQCPHYELGGASLQSCNRDVDLGVTVTPSLESSAHCALIASKAISRIGNLFRSFSTVNPRILVRAYTVFIRPILEYACTVWSPHITRDIKLIESVQDLFTRRLFRRCRLSYCESNLRSEFLLLSPLAVRRQRADLVLCWKLLNGMLDCVPSEFIKLNTRRPGMRTNGFKLEVVHCRLNIRKFFFAC